jgi:hypothetical protein
MYACVYVCMYVYAALNECTDVCMYACMHVYAALNDHEEATKTLICMYVCMRCMYVCMHVCICDFE